jgi:hypothetical protein
MEDNLDSIMAVVEHVDPSDLVQNRVIGVIGHVVGDDRWERVAFEGKDTALEENEVLIRYEVLRESGLLLISGLKK